jgi:formate dehydrogenase maturation protein FdhE
MTSTATLSRLEALETYFGGKCPVCEGWPAVRIVTTDEATKETGETRPSICPRCGSEPRSEIEIVGVDVDDLP